MGEDRAFAAPEWIGSHVWKGFGHADVVRVSLPWSPEYAFV